MNMKMFTKESQSARDIGLLILRVVFAFVVLYGHGWAKLGVLFGPDEIQFFDPLGFLGPKLSFILAAIAEGLCAMLLILGLFGRIPAIILTINFIVIVYNHAFLAKDGFPVLELRYLYLGGFLALSFLGHGRIALDNYLAKRKR